MNGKALIFDSSTIITLALNDLLYILEPLKKEFGGEFYITEQVKYELVDKSLESKKYRLEAMMIQNLINKGVITIKKNNFSDEINKLLNVANNTFKAEDEGVVLIHRGEASCLALYNSLKTGEKAIVVDERTTRMLCEKPQNLHRLLESKTHRKLRANEINYDFFKSFNIIRSSELAFIALKKGIIRLPFTFKETVEAILYALKFKGCSISFNEINQVKAM